MKAVLAFVLLATCAVAQNPAAIESARSACGPATTSFSVKPDLLQHPMPQPDPSKALIYVIEDLGQCTDCAPSRSPLNYGNITSAVTKVGMDGNWVGANKGNSYFFISVDPGEHHFCVNWQSRLAERSRAFAMFGLNAEAGKVYYLREKLFPGYYEFSFELETVNPDEGKFLVASFPYSISHPKK